MSMCERLKAHLVLHGLDAVREHELYSTHLRCCPRCAAVVKAYAELPDLLAGLPEHEPDEELIERTVTQVSAEAPRSRIGASRRRRIAGGLAAALVAVAALGLLREVANERPTAFPRGMDNFGGTPVDENEAFVDKVSAPANREINKPVAVGGLGSADERPVGQPALNLELDPGGAGGDLAAELGADRSRIVRDRREVVERMRASTRKPASEPVTEPEYDARAAVRQWADADLSEAMEPEPVAGEDHFRAERELVEPEGTSAGEDGRGARDPRQRRSSTESGDSPPLENPAAEGLAYRRKDVTRGPAGETEEDNAGPKSDLARPRRKGGVNIDSDGLGQTLVMPGDPFFARYEQTVGLTFQDASGYWASPYVPGDPAIRLLNARLASWDRSALARARELEQGVAPYRQPFDPPTGAALGLTVMADANAIDRPTRMRLQVGIQAIEHRRGRRPAMNVGIVVDLPGEAGDAERIAVRALLDALLKSRQAGDRFALTATGHGLLVDAEQFRFGPLEVAKRSLLEPDSETGTRPVDLAQTLEAAVATVRAGDDPSRPLGSSAILLLTAAELPDGVALDALRDRIHRLAADGITLSVVPLGTRPAAAAVDALVLAGLGNRRILESVDRARALIDDELHAASRAVARAARLSIRLQAGVRLIGVLGSERLDEPAAERVREIEQSMDLRLSNTLGIAADRGEDEDGIQIVIPSVYSGDSLIVLVDLLAERPGPIAEVSLRYKDLVFLQNGVLHGQLSLPQGTLARGPAQLAVQKNLLAHEFVRAVEQAADALAAGEPERARNALRSMHSSVIGVRAAVPGWDTDPELIRDQRVLENYLSVLAESEAEAYRSQLTDSLHYAAWRKTHRPPPEWQS